MTASNTVDTIEDVIRILRERPEIREAVRREILTDELLELPGKVAEMAAILREVVATREYREAVAELKADLSELKDLAAFGPAERRYEVIALEMGLEPHRLLTPGDIARLTMREAASEFSDSELESFKNCDLVIGAESPGVGECYIAVQVSYTVDHADIDRAIKHSEMVTRFTGRPGYAAVSGVERAGVTERRLASDAIHWHRLPSRELQPR